MKDLMILCDTRQQKDGHITNFFDEKGIMWVRTGLPSADYMAVRYEGGFIKDYSILIDTKKDLIELAGNLCHKSEHERVVREVEKAHDLGCQDFIFLICDDSINSVQDLAEWQSSRTKVKGATLMKVMSTFAEHHNCRFVFTKKNQAGQKIFDLLNK